ncbi:hypothetical protein R6Q59_030181 [Mikania micrantha]
MFIYKNSSESTEKCQQYIGALVEERKKIQVFERELPLCLELVSQAIERCRQQMSVMITESFGGQDDRCSDQTSSDRCPVLEEYIPMKSSSFTNEDFDDQQQLQKQELMFHKSKLTCSKDWLASAQLSLQAPNPPLEEDLLLLKKLDMEEQRNGCDSTCNLFQKKKTTTSSSADTAGGVSGGDGSNDGRRGDGDDKGRSNKKERRSWSPDLHRRFLNALEQLGGANVATPKQIREIMKVNGLTSDEIKSHLQKYRLHIRRLKPTIHDDTVAPQLVVVGRIWIPPLDYTANASSLFPLTK